MLFHVSLLKVFKSGIHIKKRTIILKLYFIQNEKIMSFFYLNFII